MNTDIYKEKLETEKTLVTEQLVGLGAKYDPETKNWEAVPETSENESDLNDLGDKHEDYHIANETVETLESRLNDVNDALVKIENGKFGTCEICGGQIEEDRLEANPAAKTCKACMNQ